MSSTPEEWNIYRNSNGKNKNRPRKKAEHGDKHISDEIELGKRHWSLEKRKKEERKVIIDMSSTPEEWNIYRKQKLSLLRQVVFRHCERSEAI